MSRANKARKAVIGDVQHISLDFGEPKAGEIYHVRILVEKPTGEIEANYIDYQFYEPIERLSNSNVISVPPKPPKRGRK